MANEKVKQEFIHYMNTNCTDDPPHEDILAGQPMQDSENIAHGEKMSTAYWLADELLTPDNQQLYWDDEARIWSIGPLEE